MKMKWSSKYLKANILLNQGNMRYIPSNTIVDTNFLSPCLGVIVHDKKNQRAYASHLAYPQDGSLVRLLNRAISELGDSKNLYAYCVGNSPAGELDDLDNMYVQHTIKTRAFVVSTLEEFGFDRSKTIFRWTPRPEQYAKLKLDVNSGKTEYTLFGHPNGRTLYKGSISDC